MRVTSASLSQRGQAAQPASCPTGVKTRDLRKDLLGAESAVLEQGQKREECQGLQGGDGDRSYRNVPDLGQSLEKCTLCSQSANLPSDFSLEPLRSEVPAQISHCVCICMRWIL